MRCAVQTPPRGQGLIEMMIVLVVFGALLSAIGLIGVVGQAGLSTTLAARLAAFECDSRPDYCRQIWGATQQRIQREMLTTLGSGRQEDMASRQSLGANRRLVERPSDIRLSVDLPRVDGADRNLLEKLADAFRSFTLKAGPALFSLASPDQLTRSTVSTDLWGSRSKAGSSLLMPNLQLTSRLALISDSWSAASAQEFYQRVRLGQTPSRVTELALAALYIPAKDILMPALDFVGLESGTDAFRGNFHDPHLDLPYAITRVRQP